MAKRDLDILAKKISGIVEEKKQFIRDQLNTLVHIYTINDTILFNQVSVQLKRVKKYSSFNSQDFDNKLKGICSTAAPEVLKALTQYKGSKATVSLTPGTSDTVYIKPLQENLDVFTFIRNTRRDRLIKYLRDPIIKELFSSYTNSNKYQQFMEQSDPVLLAEKSSPSSFYSKKVNALDSALFGGYTRKKGEEGLVRDSNKRAVRSGGFSHLGHLKENAVSKRLQAIAVDTLLDESDLIRSVFPNNEVVIKVIRDFRNKLGTFGFEISIIEESAFANLSDSAKEKKALQTLGEQLKRELLKEIDWPNQRGSSSANEIIAAALINSAIDSVGRKVKVIGKKKKINKTPSESIDKILSNKRTRTRSKGKKYSPVSITEPTGPSTSAITENKPNWLQLLPLINAKLTPRVIKNMGSPRLNNRTGRLAQSARVTNVEQTPQGFPSFVFDYERDPYDVFDRTLGSSPWNTPQRDPRALVDQSVREIVREMAIGRFFTRRA